MATVAPRRNIPLHIIAPCFECGSLAEYKHILPDGLWGLTYCAACLVGIARQVDSNTSIHIRLLDITDVPWEGDLWKNRE